MKMKARLSHLIMRSRLDESWNFISPLNERISIFGASSEPKGKLELKCEIFDRAKAQFQTHTTPTSHHATMDYFTNMISLHTFSHGGSDVS